MKANDAEQPLLFERTTVMRQIRALQLLETVNLMAAGEDGLCVGTAGDEDVRENMSEFSEGERLCSIRLLDITRPAK